MFRRTSNAEPHHGIAIKTLNLGALFAGQAAALAGPQGFIRKMSLKYHAMVFVREAVSGGGAVSGLRFKPGRQVATLREGDPWAAGSLAEVQSPFARG